jgi:hypothetical protein
LLVSIIFSSEASSTFENSPDDALAPVDWFCLSIIHYAGRNNDFAYSLSTPQNPLQPHKLALSAMFAKKWKYSVIIWCVGCDKRTINYKNRFSDFLLINIIRKKF